MSSTHDEQIVAGVDGSGTAVLTTSRTDPTVLRDYGSGFGSSAVCTCRTGSPVLMYLSDSSRDSHVSSIVARVLYRVSYLGGANALATSKTPDGYRAPVPPNVDTPTLIRSSDCQSVFDLNSPHADLPPLRRPQYLARVWVEDVFSFGGREPQNACPQGPRVAVLGLSRAPDCSECERLCPQSSLDPRRLSLPAGPAGPIR
jgi:hypothetical protein